MKRAWFLLLFAFFLLASFSFASAATNATEEQEKVADAYSCLDSKVSGKCTSLSTEEKIFSLLAIDQCQSELFNASKNSGECWSNTQPSSCKIKTTSQAILALDNTGADTGKAQAWLLTQNRTPAELDWFLEIEADSATTCQISYSGISTTVAIGADKKLNSNAGSCLTLAQDDYWLRVSPSCYGEEFEVSCDQGFLTTLLFQKQNSATIHVLEQASSASANGFTTEKVESACFADGNSCTYEGTLWAALVLDSLDKDVSAYLPYLITLAEDNRRFLPESFLYLITADTDYRTNLLGKQKSNKWWLESGDKLYDTALALYPFQSETLTEKTNSKSWLLTTQDANGCWENNIRNTAFVLASIWPRDFDSTDITDLPDCEAAGFYCTSQSACTGSSGTIFSDFECPSLFKCCNIQPSQETCFELGGEICSLNQVCQGGTTTSTPDLDFNQECCIGGSCASVSTDDGTDTTGDISECEISGGVCDTTSCSSNEQEISAACSFSSDTCCIPKSQKPRNYTWVWIFLILIVLVVLGIVFRNHLRHFWFKMKDSFGGRGTSSRPAGPGYPSYPTHHMPIRRSYPIERRILLPSPVQHARPLPGKTIKSRAQKELDDVLKKLKDMSK